MPRIIVLALMLIIAAEISAQQKVIQLYDGAAPGSESWTYQEQVYKAGTPAAVIYNVSHPTLTVYPADPSVANGTAVIVCPGGGFFILAGVHEGSDVAQWLNKKGVTVFLLNYRLGQSATDNPGQELSDNMKKTDFIEKIKTVVPLSIADGRAAIQYVRAHAAEYKITPTRIGIMGFSAGGTVAAASAFGYSEDNRPDFVAPIYGYMPPQIQGTVSDNAPPLFLTVASDDNLGLASHSIDLYSKWLAAKKPVELHVYQTGSHGFGMHKKNIPTDTWIERFGDWLNLLGYLKKS
ncbi:MAG: alpha/beta hydrolase [Chitinophagaceae bacterium]|nr:MAG: alpha/beta hydrolase [Chitinophagaceae bacterium]